MQPNFPTPLFGLCIYLRERERERERERFAFIWLICFTAYQILICYSRLKFESFVNVWLYSGLNFRYIAFFEFLFFHISVIICLHTVIWYQAFLSNTNNLQTSVWYIDWTQTDISTLVQSGPGSNVNVRDTLHFSDLQNRSLSIRCSLVSFLW